MNESASTSSPLPDEARLRRWRLVLGGDAESACGKLSGEMAEMDQALSALYEADGKNGLGRSNSRQGGRGGSAPSVARWLGDIRKYFPSLPWCGACFLRSARASAVIWASAPRWDEELAALPLPFLRAILGVAA